MYIVTRIGLLLLIFAYLIFPCFLFISYVIIYCIVITLYNLCIAIAMYLPKTSLYICKNYFYTIYSTRING